MWPEILNRYLHFIAIMVLAGSLVAEHLLGKGQVIRSQIKRMVFINWIFWISGAVVLFAGLNLWIGVGKPKEFYTQNPVMHIKLTLFLLLGALSIYPSLTYRRFAKGSLEDIVELPSEVVWLVRFELLFLFAIPFTATLLAKGIGLP